MPAKIDPRKAAKGADWLAIGLGVGLTVALVLTNRIWFLE
jgi:hypothetical protein